MVSMCADMVAQKPFYFLRRDGGTLQLQLVTNVKSEYLSSELLSEHFTIEIITVITRLMCVVAVTLVHATVITV
jgi:phosphoserine aminotransferase